MSNERLRILDMLKDGKISVSEADELLTALDAQTPNPELAAADSGARKNLKHLRIVVDPENGRGGKKERVNIRVPLALLRAGAKIHSILPQEVRDKVEGAMKEKGVDFSLADVKAENIEPFIEALGDMSIDVEAKDKKVRIFCE